MENYYGIEYGNGNTDYWIYYLPYRRILNSKLAAEVLCYFLFKNNAHLKYGKQEKFRISIRDLKKEFEVGQDKISNALNLLKSYNFIICNTPKGLETEVFVQRSKINIAIGFYNLIVSGRNYEYITDNFLEEIFDFSNDDLIQRIFDNIKLFDDVKLRTINEVLELRKQKPQENKIKKEKYSEKELAEMMG